MPRAVIIANPAARSITPQVVGQARELCRGLTGEVVVRWTAEPGHATRLAESISDSPGTTVLAVGGDGTAREVVAGLAGGDSPMFIVPAGTANSCYRSFWGDVAWPRALEQALAKPAAHSRRLDLARLAGHGSLVLAGASTGFAPQAIEDAAALTGLTGPARYERALADLAPVFEPYPGRVTVDGVEVHKGLTMLANVGGSRYRGGQFVALPHSVVDDGLLDVCVISGDHDPAEMLRLARAGLHLTRSGVTYARGRTITLERTDGKPVRFEHDGEVLPGGGTRFTLEVLPNAVPMLVGEAVDLGRRTPAA